MTIAPATSETIEDILTRYESYLQDCRNHIASELKSNPITSVLAAYFQGGKMLRALLVFLIASATGTDPRRMIKVAAALELLHGASLIHDDIVDEARERRGASRPPRASGSWGRSRPRGLFDSAILHRPPQRR
jgi:heptaprenyl diphosphate synthase